MKILIGVDESKFSEAALEFVRRMPWPKDTRVIVASSVPLPMPLYPEVYAIAPSQEAFEQARQANQEFVTACAQKLRGAGFDVDPRVLQGDPRATLVDLAESERVDLIVVGSHGRTGLEKLLMGSVTTHIVSHARCSTLVVKMGKK